MSQSIPRTTLPMRALLAVTWISTGIFSLYIALFYGGAILAGSLERDWNEVLPRLYEKASTPAAWMIGMHFFAGSAVLLLGPLQFSAALRTRRPAVHRWTGRVYVVSALAAGVGGVSYLLLKGAVGGLVMDIGFGLYGVLTVLAALMAWIHARARRFELHRAWAIRLFALGIGSWLYRLDYGIWLKLVGGIGHAPHSFDGPFDLIMDFFFYVPNLLVAEVFIRRAHRPQAGTRCPPWAATWARPAWPCWCCSSAWPPGCSRMPTGCPISGAAWRHCSREKMLG